MELHRNQVGPEHRMREQESKEGGKGRKKRWLSWEDEVLKGKVGVDGGL